MRFLFIHRHRDIFAIRLMCRVLEVSASCYYDWVRRVPSHRRLDDLRLAEKIKAIHDASRRVYGTPRVHAELRVQGEHISRRRVARLMRQQNLQAKQKRKFRVTTDSRHNHPVAPNLLQRQFTVAQPNTAWVADITYIHTREGWLYLAAIMDLATRQIVGWAMDCHMPWTLVARALVMALQRRNPPPGLIHHSDRGSQYACGEYRKLMNEHGLICSMSRKGDCWDNAAMESFFHSMKVERVHHCDYKSHDEAKRDLFDYIEVFYNRQRRHSHIGYRTPAEAGAFAA